jgi:hypothetical protein
VQIVREDSALSYRCRASVMWRIGLALYAKAGGVAWRLADSDEETAWPARRQWNHHDYRKRP